MVPSLGLIGEVKGDDMLDDAAGQTKRRYAEEVAGDMRYELVAASKINQGKALEVLGNALARQR